mmetsp:Transcript_105316/g.303864  ORF Transcript_105316/g.303864 Transcript_105316/m.303864 type:complete len:476 (-) Transcript_105316:362-1789(-)
MSRHLIIAGANVNAVDKEGNTPLSVAIQNGHIGCRQLLMTAGAHAEAKTLTLAIQSDQIDFVRLLLDDEAHRKTVSEAGWREHLNVAARKSSSEYMRLLLECEVDVRAETEGGPMSALHIAALFGCVESMRMLLQAGARVDGGTSGLKNLVERDSRDDHDHEQHALNVQNNVTALHCAAYGGHYLCVLVAVAAGADPQKTSEDYEAVWTESYMTTSYENTYDEYGQVTGTQQVSGVGKKKCSEKIAGKNASGWASCKGHHNYLEGIEEMSDLDSQTWAQAKLQIEDTAAANEAAQSVAAALAKTREASKAAAAKEAAESVADALAKAREATKAAAELVWSSEQAVETAQEVVETAQEAVETAQEAVAVATKAKFAADQVYEEKNKVYEEKNKATNDAKAKHASAAAQEKALEVEMFALKKEPATANASTARSTAAASVTVRELQEALDAGLVSKEEFEEVRSRMISAVEAAETDK